MSQAAPTQLINELLNHSKQTLQALEQLQQMQAVSVGDTPNTVVHHDGKMQLRYYAPAASPCCAPLLIVYALVNRPYILDLQPDRSLIRSLNQQGIPVYLIDWGYADAGDCYMDLDDYINGYIDDCVETVKEHQQCAQVNILGVCQGGVLSLCYSALYPDKVASLITLVTPVDFHTPDNLLTPLARHLDTGNLVETLGNFPGQIMTRAYNALMPARLGLRKQLSSGAQLSNHAAAANYIRMERWINDCPDHAGRAFQEFIDSFFRENRFITGGLEVNGEPINLQQLKLPILNLFARQDHLVPPDASRALGKLVGSRDYTEEELPGGHIGVFVGRQAQGALPKRMAGWLAKRNPV